jgi:4'-phosphopantetheinyl transferase
VAVFDTDLDSFLPRLAAFHLSEAERRRAAQYKVPGVGDRFVLRRGILRMLLAGYAGLMPSQIDIDDTGKPRLRGELALGCLDFSVSSSGARALYAFSWNRLVGIDVENMCNPVDYVSICRQFFTPRESECIERLPPADQKPAFFDCWTRKEAYLKAAGIRPLNAFDTGISSGVFEDLSDPKQNRRWAFLDLPLGADWKSCLALECLDREISGTMEYRRIV